MLYIFLLNKINILFKHRLDEENKASTGFR